MQNRYAPLLILLPLLLLIAGILLLAQQTPFPTFVATGVLVAFLIATLVFARQSSPPGYLQRLEPAQKLIALATKQAKLTDKNILIFFTASWCNWCRRLDQTLIYDKDIGKIITSYYEVVYLNVLETPDNKYMENPDGSILMVKMGSVKAGLPFYAIFDTAGKKLGDSNRMPGNQNIGYPGSADEITAFVQLLKETAPKISDAELTQIGDHLRKNAPTQ